MSTESNHAQKGEVEIEIDFRRAVAGMEGLLCGGVYGGVAIARELQLLFGSIAVRPFTLKSGRILNTESSEIALFVGDAAWRLEQGKRVLCSSTSGIGNESHMDLGVRRLKGRRVVGVQLVDVSFDLRLTFDSDIVLHIFCDQTNRDERADNYSLMSGPDYFTVGSESVLLWAANKA